MAASIFINEGRATVQIISETSKQVACKVRTSVYSSISGCKQRSIPTQKRGVCLLCLFLVANQSGYMYSTINYFSARKLKIERNVLSLEDRSAEILCHGSITNFESKLCYTDIRSKKLAICSSLDH